MKIGSIASNFHGIMAVMERAFYRDLVDSRLRRAPVVALLGARQVGKSTLARDIANQWQATGIEATFFDLENPTAVDRLANPMFALSNLRGLVVLDEIQRRPDLFPVLRVLSDREDTPARFLILGSASRDLLQQSSESLAGRIAYIDLPPFGVMDMTPLPTERLWTRGGYPRSFLAETEPDSVQWREDYLRTTIERDLPALGLQLPPLQLRRFWTMLAHNHGNILNASSIGNSLDISHHTVRRYLDFMIGALLVRELKPWFINVAKRQVKSPKIYLRDSGILHRLLALDHAEAVLSSPIAGASWEGLALEQTCQALQVRDDEAAFWSIHEQAELDLYLPFRSVKVGFEFKMSDSVKMTKSMHSALEHLELGRLFVVYPGSERYPLHEKVEAIPLEHIRELAQELDG